MVHSTKFVPIFMFQSYIPRLCFAFTSLVLKIIYQVDFSPQTPIYSSFFAQNAFAQAEEPQDRAFGSVHLTLVLLEILG